MVFLFLQLILEMYGQFFQQLSNISVMVIGLLHLKSVQGRGEGVDH